MKLPDIEMQKQNVDSSLLILPNIKLIIIYFFNIQFFSSTYPNQSSQASYSIQMFDPFVFLEICDFKSCLYI